MGYERRREPHHWEQCCSSSHHCRGRRRQGSHGSDDPINSSEVTPEDYDESKERETHGKEQSLIEDHATSCAGCIHLDVGGSLNWTSDLRGKDICLPSRNGFPTGVVGCSYCLPDTGRDRAAHLEWQQGGEREYTPIQARSTLSNEEWSELRQTHRRQRRHLTERVTTRSALSDDNESGGQGQRPDSRI